MDSIELAEKHKRELENDKGFIAYKAKVDAYQKENGARALSMHIFQIGKSEAISEKLPVFKMVEGFPVIVKLHTQDKVTLVNMLDGSEFIVSMIAYNACCQNIWMLDESLQIRNPAQWERDREIYDRGLKACGF